MILYSLTRKLTVVSRFDRSCPSIVRCYWTRCESQKNVGSLGDVTANIWLLLMLVSWICDQLMFSQSCVIFLMKSLLQKMADKEKDKVRVIKWKRLGGKMFNPLTLEKHVQFWTHDSDSLSEPKHTGNCVGGYEKVVGGTAYC